MNCGVLVENNTFIFQFNANNTLKSNNVKDTKAGKKTGASINISEPFFSLLFR